MEIIPFHNEDIDKLKSIQLLDEDAKFTKTPLENIESSRTDNERNPTLVLENSMCIAFFTLHVGAGPAEYTLNSHAILFRSFSVDVNYRNQGYAKKILTQLPEYIKTYFPGKDEIILTVNTDNEKAIHLYEKAGYHKIKTSYLIGRPVWVMSLKI